MSVDDQMVMVMGIKEKPEMESDDSMEDNSGNGNLGILVGDYRMKFRKGTKEPDPNDMKSTANDNSDKKAF